MRAASLLTASAIVALTGVSSASAEPAYTVSALNVRAGPGTDYPVVAALASNTDVDIVACLEGRTWCDVAVANGRGWVAGEFLAYTSDGRVVAQTGENLPVTTYNAGTYFDENYANRDFYAQRDQFVDRDYPTTATTTTTTTTTGSGGGGTLTGVAGGAAVGAIVGGPVGAVVGGIAGGMAGAAIEPPGQVRTYVVEHRVEPVVLEGQVAVGSGLPEQVELYPVPDYEYEYTYVNGQAVLVDPGTRQIVYIVQ